MEIYAHRGLHPPHIPENTLESFRLAVQYSPNIELDVRSTKDSEVIVIHDETVDATTDGHGLVSELTLGEIQRLNARARGSNVFSYHYIPSLGDVLSHMPSTTKYQIELKEQKVIEPALSCLSRLDPTRYFFTSFDHVALVKTQSKAPRIPRLFLLHPQKGLEEELSYLHHLQDAGIIFQGVGIADRLPGLFEERLTEPLIQMFKREGYQVGCYVVDNPERAKALEKMGIDGLVTDRIDLFKDFQ